MRFMHEMRECVCVCPGVVMFMLVEDDVRLGEDGHTGGNVEEKIPPLRRPFIVVDPNGVRTE